MSVEQWKVQDMEAQVVQVYKDVCFRRQGEWTGAVPELRIMRDQLDGVLVQLTQKLLATGVNQAWRSVEWPRNWWQALRKAVLPAWWLRKHPVKMERQSFKTVSYGRLCPHMMVREERDRTSHLFFLKDMDGTGIRIEDVLAVIDREAKWIANLPGVTPLSIAEELKMALLRQFDDQTREKEA